MAFGATTNGLGALEISLLFCHSLTCNGLSALSCPFKMAVKMGALQNPYFKAWYKWKYFCILRLDMKTQNEISVAYN